MIVALINQLNYCFFMFGYHLVAVLHLVMDDEVLAILIQRLSDTLNIFVHIASLNIIGLRIADYYLLTGYDKLSFLIEYIEIRSHYLDPT